MMYLEITQLRYSLNGIVSHLIKFFIVSPFHFLLAPEVGLDLADKLRRLTHPGLRGLRLMVI
jgi:hypothetical protein